jgi:histidine ammonia-lyase
MNDLIFELHPGQLTYEDIHYCLNESVQLRLTASAIPHIEQSRALVEAALVEGHTHYGINTGFGKLASTLIPATELLQLQRNLIRSHATGVGIDLPNSMVRLILLLKIDSLARGYSGVRLQLIETLIDFFNHQIYPCIPAQGSVGASGDLAPLAHFSLCLIGEGFVNFHGERMPAATALQRSDIQPLELQAKEGLALANGLQVSCALALTALLRADQLYDSALKAGALSIEAIAGLTEPFLEVIHAVRGQHGQISAAKRLRELLQQSQIARPQNIIQNPYSIRCIPQVMGAVKDQLNFARDILLIEANAVSDNPLVFVEQQQILSGGNFHGEPIAMAADNMALAIAEIGALSERRIALLLDPQFSGLPPFLTENSGLNSGFMNLQVTAASLVSENKALAHPLSVDSLPTSANQEDHVSMATYAARRLLTMLDNLENIIAIELLAAAQGVDFRGPEKLAPALQPLQQQIRTHSARLSADRSLSQDINAITAILR